MTYTHELHRAQVPAQEYLDSDNFPEECELLTEVVSPRDEAKIFRRRLPDADPEQLKWAIITLWEGSPWQEKIFEAPTAIYWLQITGHISAEQRITSPDNFLRLWVQRERERAAGLAPVAFSEPFSPVEGGAS